MTRYLNTTEAGKYLGVTKWTLRKWRTLGTGPSYEKRGQADQARCYYDIEELQAWRMANSTKVELIPAVDF